MKTYCYVDFEGRAREVDDEMWMARIVRFYGFLSDHYIFFYDEIDETTDDLIRKYADAAQIIYKSNLGTEDGSTWRGFLAEFLREYIQETEKS